MIEEIKNRILAGGEITPAEAVELSKVTDRESLYAAADEIRRALCGNKLDTCSIVNARSGKCPENCKWCSQSAHHQTGVEIYPILPEEEVMKMARVHDRQGIKRFSLVTSGRTVRKTEMTEFCKMFRRIHAETGMRTCASMGLLNREELEMLKEAGVKRYHCNLETASSYFPTLCTTHTTEDKKKTIRIAKELGFEICSGGIIGMGETIEQRIEMAFELKVLGAESVPMNILNPIPGTKLENTPLISEDDVLLTIAIFRFILPRTRLMFAGGRARLSRESQKKALLSGLNASMVGDLLTTIGNNVKEDMEMFRESGYDTTR
ncbi:biotin synthase BioB [Barnesiella propionica]|uniref:biotin synthase BioB n=1 Tax=Barnesiella propionica TaxID=2981781 RepID=UPI0011C8C97F|nr:biotin synthase BioB [Barnesiella propionica]MCU6769243.1 biotin synthase BioB [Barnesiella propionica]